MTATDDTTRSTLTDEERYRLRAIADFQFGRSAGEALFSGGTVRVTRSRSDRVNQIHDDDGRVATFGLDGRFTLGLAGGRRLFSAFDFPTNRVAIGDESEPFVRDGRNVFAKFVRGVDPTIRAGDEVLVVHLPDDGSLEDGGGTPETLVAVGRAELDATAMTDFRSGMAVSIRDSVD